MRPDSIAVLIQLFDHLRPVFSKPTFFNFLILAFGWLLTSGRHAVTAALVATGWAHLQHHAAFHRFFARAKWQPDEVGRSLFQLCTQQLHPQARLSVSLDDTLAKKTGKKIFGTGHHYDAVESTGTRTVIGFGHVWIVLSLNVHPTFSKRPWTLPILFRLYRGKKDCHNSGAPYQSKTQLAHQMLEVLQTWLDGRPCDVALDSAYCNRTVLKDRPNTFRVVGCMRPDAALYATPDPRKPGQRGRPRKIGKRLRTPLRMAQDGRRPWREAQVHLYRRTKRVRYKVVLALWYRVTGLQLLKIVIVETPKARSLVSVFFSTDVAMSAEEVLEGYAGRWPIEVLFSDLKQQLGFAASSARSEGAVLRTAPFAGYLYTLVVLWFMQAGFHSKYALLPIRPWYPQKVAPSFVDMLFAMRRAILDAGFFDPQSGYENLHKVLHGFEVPEGTEDSAIKKAA